MSSLGSSQASPLDPFRLAAAQHLHSVLGVPLEKALDGIESGRAGKNARGDFMVALPRFRLGGDPKAHAQKVADSLQPNEHLASAVAEGAFVSYTVNSTALNSTVLAAINEATYLNLASSVPEPSMSGDDKALPSRFNPNGYGSNKSGEGKTLTIDFSSPNIAKPFHAGHLRSTIIGAFLSNLHEANGWKVVRINYLGDWGKQFGLLAVGFEKYGSEEELKKDAITHLYDVYVKINKDGEDESSDIHDRARLFFKGMEDGDEASIALWKKFRDLSIAKYKQIYARLNIHFDTYSGESSVSNANQAAAVDRLVKMGVVEESENALIINLEDYKLGKTIVRKRDGTYVYLTRDIAGAAERKEKYNFDKMLYVVASQQDLSFSQLFKVLELMGYDWAKVCHHINFGMVQGMSTRKGTAVFLDQILDESKDVMHEQMKKNQAKYEAVDDPEETSDKLGITAVKIQDMCAKRINNYKFEWSRMTSFEGDTGPYLQYAHVRLSSVERKNAPDLVLPSPSERASTINTALLTEPAAKSIVMLLASYPDTVKAALISLEPSTICTFCFRLCHAISTAWEVLRVKGEDREVAMARLWLFVCARDVLGTAMKLLTLEPLEKM